MKQGKIQPNPTQSQFTSVIQQSIQRIVSQLKQLKCATKSYLPQLKPGNYLNIITPNFKCQQLQQFNQSINNLKYKLFIIQHNFKYYFQSINHHIKQICYINNQIQKKLQKKNSYSDIQQIIDKINYSQSSLNNLIKINQFSLCGLYSINFTQIKIKYTSKTTQLLKQLSNILIQKIYKDNQKIDKIVQSIQQNMQKIPNTIAQFVQLQKYVVQTVKQEIQKTHHKAKILTQKLNTLEKTNQIIQYNQFQLCCKIYLKPLKLQKIREDILFRLQYIYKKNFADDLLKDSQQIIDNIKICQKMFNKILQYKSLQQMDKYFLIFSQLNLQLENSYQKIFSINQKQSLLKWNITNFNHLLQIKQLFEPYYKLITTHKYHKLNLIPLLDQSISQINYNLIITNINANIQILQNLKNNRFNKDCIYQPIVQHILQNYLQFNSYLSLIKILRNPDLRDRHWINIQKITQTTNIRSDHITLKQILQDSIKTKQSQIQKISQIATKQLIYQKSLNQLKKQWKDIKITIKQIKLGNQSYKFIKNISDIQKKLQDDTILINNILASSFIQFLQIDIIQWKSTVLQKIYQFINYWLSFQQKVSFCIKFLNLIKISTIFPQWSDLKKTFDKLWKQLILHLQNQSTLIQIINSKIWQNINNIQLQIQQIQKILYLFLQEKKKHNSKLRLFSDHTLANMIIQPNLQSIFDNLKKCFNATKSIKKIQDPFNPTTQPKIQITSTLNQNIFIKFQQKDPSPSPQSPLSYQFDQILLHIDKQLKKQIKSTFLSSLQTQSLQSHQLLGQVQLLKLRLIFKNKLQKQFHLNQQFTTFQLYLINNKIQISKKIWKTTTHKQLQLYNLYIIQFINQLNIIHTLNPIQYPLTSFQWYKQPKYDLYQHSPLTNNTQKLKLTIGNYSRQYLFQLTQCQKYIANPFSDAVFLNICTALSDRIMVILQGCNGAGRAMHFNYLGELLGRNVTNVTCSTVTSPTNLLQYLKIAASGIFLVLQQMHKLPKQSISLFQQTLATFWINYQLSKSPVTAFYLGTQQIILDVNNFSFFGISNAMSHLTLSNSIKQCFRTFHVVSIKPKYLLQCALFSYGFTQINKIDISFIPTIIDQLTYQQKLGKMVTHIRVNDFAWQVAKKFYQLAHKINIKSNQNIQQIQHSNQIQLQNQLLHQSVKQILNLYIPQNQNQQNQIWKSIYQLKLLPNKNPIQPQQQPKTQNQPLTDNQDPISTQSHPHSKQHLKTLLDFHCGVLIIDSQLSTKSSLITQLMQQSSSTQHYNFISLNPLAYTMKQLYQGNNSQKPIIQQLIEQLKIKSNALQQQQQLLQVQCKVTNGLHFDCNIGQWLEPLISILNKPQMPRISCSDGSLLTLPPRIKLIFETQHIHNIIPNTLHSLGIIYLNQKINWKKSYNNLITKYLGNQFPKTPNAQFTKQLFQQTFDSSYQFYQSVFHQKSLKSAHKSKFQIIQKTLILQYIIRFFYVIYTKNNIQLISQNIHQQNNTHKKNKSFQQKIKTQIFNIFVYSLISTLGLLIPQQSRKTFSRNFKYVIQQSHLSRYGLQKNTILTRDNQNIYQFCYDNKQWKKWKCQQFYLRNQYTVFLDKYQILEKILTHYIDNGIPCFIIGEQNSNKNHLFLNFIQQLKQQKYSKNYFSFSKLTLKFQIINKINQMIQIQKYSKKLNGFSNNKKNLIYVEDLNITMLSDNPSRNGSVIELIRQFYRKKNLYINNTLHGFENLEFYGTLNQNLPIPTTILRFIHPILMSTSENMVPSILQYYIKSSPITLIQKQLLVKCTQNLHQVILRDLTQTQTHNKLGHKFYITDMIKVVKGVSKILQNLTTSQTISMQSILRYWVYMISQIYEPKISISNKKILFYLINNVLMQQHRVRYKTICPTSDFYLIGLPNEKYYQGDLDQKIKYSTYTIKQLQQKLYNIILKYNTKNKYLLLLIDQKSKQLIKLIQKFLNAFTFNSKTIILFNQQKTKLQSILKIISFINTSMYCSSQSCTISSSIPINTNLKLQKIINSKFSKQYFKFFQSQFIQNKSYKYHSKNKIIMHLSDVQQDHNSQSTTHSNFILQDLLSYMKLGKHPKWSIPKQQHLQSLPQNPLQSPSNTKRQTLLHPKFLNRDSKDKDNYKQTKFQDQICQNMELYVILQYYHIPQYLVNNYNFLIDECSLIFLKNIQPQPAQTSKSVKVLMTDVKNDQQLQPDYDYQKQLKSLSPSQLQKKAVQSGNKIYMNLIYQLINQYLKQKTLYSSNYNQYILSSTYSFQTILIKFLTIKKQRITRKINVQFHAHKMIQLSKNIQEKLQSKKKQYLFHLEQQNVKSINLSNKINKDNDKYHLEKKKICDIQSKISITEKQYQDNLTFYRQSMDKYSFQFGKSKQKLIKVFTSFQNGKYNFVNTLTNENKQMLQTLSYILYLVDLKKLQQTGGAALRQLSKYLKQKKLTKFLQKSTIDSLPLKALLKSQKLILQLEMIKQKNLQLKKPIKLSSQDQTIILRDTLSQFLSISLIAAKQYNSQKIKQSFQNIQNHQKSLQKLKSDLTKKQNNKLIKQLFSNYDQSITQQQQINKTITQHNTHIKQINQSLKSLSNIINLYIPQIIAKSNQLTSIGQQKQCSALVMAVCVRFFNQMHYLSTPQIQTIFTNLATKLAYLQVPQLNWYTPLKQSPNIVINSLFNYKGYILIQLKPTYYSTQQNRQLLQDLFYFGKTCRSLTPTQLQNISNLQLTSYDAVIINIQYLTSSQSIEKVQQILGIDKHQQYWGKPIFIQSSYFSSQQMLNYPYINLVNNHQNITNIPYSYISNKIKNNLFSQNNQQIKSITTQNQSLTQQFHHSNDDLFANFITIQLQDNNNIQNITNCQKKIQQLFALFTPQPPQQNASKPEIKIDKVEKTEQQDQAILTDKHKQKILIQHKSCQFLTKYYIILTAFNGLTNPSTYLSLTSYLSIISKTLKIHSTTLVTSHFSPQAIPLKCINTFIKSYPSAKIQLPKYFILLLTNDKINNFISQDNYHRYLQLCIQSIYHQDIIYNQSSISQIIKICTQKFMTNVIGFQSLLQQLINNYDQWQNDVNTIYKQLTDPPIQWIYFMLRLTSHKFWQYIQRMEKKIILKQTSNQPLQIYPSIQQKLHNIFNLVTVNKNSYHLQKDFNANCVPVINSVFLSTEHRYHQVVKFLQHNKLQYEFLYFQKYLNCQQNNAPQNQNYRKNPNNTQPDIYLFQPSKIPIVFIKTQLQLKQYEDFIKLYQKSITKKKPINQDQTPQIKILVLSQLTSHQPIKNSIIINQNTNKSQLYLQLMKNILVKEYQYYVNDKNKCKQYDSMPLKFKKFVFQIQLSTIQSLFTIPLNPHIDPYYLLKRSTAIIQKLSKLSKSPKPPQSSLSSPNPSHQTSQNIQLQKLQKSYLHIFYQNHFQQYQLIKNIIKYSQHQSNIFIDDQLFTVNKFNTFVTESKTFLKINKLSFKNKLLQVNQQISNIMSQHLVNTRNPSTNIIQQLYMKISQKSPQPSSSLPIIKGIQLSDLLYLLTRKYAIQQTLPVYSTTCCLQLLQNSPVPPQIKYTLSPISLRSSFQQSLQQTPINKNQFILAFIPDLKGQTSQLNTLKNKGILISHQQLSIYQLFIHSNIAALCNNTHTFLIADIGL